MSATDEAGCAGSGSHPSGRNPLPLRNQALSQRLKTCYPELTVVSVDCVTDGYHGDGSTSQWLVLVGTREHLLAFKLADDHWFPVGRKRVADGQTEFGDSWHLKYLKGGRFKLQLDVRDWPLAEDVFRRSFSPV